MTLFTKTLSALPSRAIRPDIALLVLASTISHLSLWAQDHYHVRAEPYPEHAIASRLRPATAATPQILPVLYDSRWEVAANQIFLVEDELQIADKSRWKIHDQSLGFTLGCDTRFVLNNGQVLYGQDAEAFPGRTWYLWFRWPRSAALQPLRYVYSNSDDEYCNDDNSASGSEGAFFAPADGSTFLRFWENNKDAINAHLSTADQNTRRHAKAVIWRQFAKICPKTFTDTLRENFGWEGANLGPEPTPDETVNVVDLLPGMRLRIEWAGFQEDAGEQLSGDQLMLRGFVGQGTSYWQITSQRSFSGTHPQLSMDPFLGHLAQLAKSPQGEGNPNLAAGAPDFGLSVGGIPLGTKYRLIYPEIWFGGFTPSISAPAMPPSSDSGQPDTGQPPEPAPRDTGSLRSTMRDHVLIAASPCRRGLSGEELYNLIHRADSNIKWTTNWTDPVANFKRSVKGFRGRTYAVPEIQVTVQGEHRYVSVGTRLSQLVDSSSSIEDRLTRRRIRMTRHHNGRPVPVRFENEDNISLYDIPLTKGDDVRW